MRSFAGTEERSGGLGHAVLHALVIVGLVGCGSIKVSNREVYEGERLARPRHVYVHDFAARATDLPSWSEAAQTYAGQQAIAEESEIATARELGGHMAEELVARIDAMGLEAERADAETRPAPGDVVIVGFLGSVDEGSRLKRMVVGFGAGAAEVSTHVEGYLATAAGYQKLGSGDASTKKNRVPGLVVPIAVTAATANPLGLLIMTPVKIGTEVVGRNTAEGVGKRMAGVVADQLEPKFREQGWLTR
jgi:Domain of unknown function (DUF4410)